MSRQHPRLHNKFRQVYNNFRQFYDVSISLLICDRTRVMGCFSTIYDKICTTNCDRVPQALSLLSGTAKMNSEFVSDLSRQKLPESCEECFLSAFGQFLGLKNTQRHSSPEAAKYISKLGL